MGWSGNYELNIWMEDVPRRAIFWNKDCKTSGQDLSARYPVETEQNTEKPQDNY